MTMLLNKLNLTTVRENTENEVVVELLSFLIYRILDIINMLLFFQFKLKMAVHVTCKKEKFEQHFTLFKKS